MIRITAFGDSFIYGAEVLLRESWAKQLIALNPSLQVLNYGVTAYGLDQAYLRYLKVGNRDHPHIVFIGYMSENLSRHVNVFRPFYSRSYGRTIFTKPRFRLVDGALELLDNPIATLTEHSRLLHSSSRVLGEIGVHDYHYQTGYRESGLDFLPSVRFGKIVWSELKKQARVPILKAGGMYHEKSEALEVTVAVFDAFYREVLRRGALPVILIFPDGRDQYRDRNGKPPRYEPLLRTLRAREYRFLDVMQALAPAAKKHTIQELFVKTRHYSPLGSRIVAQYLSRRLEEAGLTDLVTIRQALLAEQSRLGIEAPSLAGEESAPERMD